MINSLFKDSHITRKTLCPKPYSHETKKQYLSSVVPEKDKFTTVINKPAQISFSGLFSGKDIKKLVCSRDIESLSGIKKIFNAAVNQDIEVKNYFLKDLLSSAKLFIVDGKSINKEDKEATKLLHQSTKELIEKSVDFLQNQKKELTDETVKKFLGNESNRNMAEELLEKIKTETKLKNKNDEEFPIDLDSTEYKNFVKKQVGEAVDMLHSVEDPSWLYKSEGVKKFLRKAEKSQAVFSALFAVALACVLRPLTIISLPGKKNKDDKKYASAHSIASGAIGYTFAMLIASPIAKGIEKITKDPTKFLNPEQMKNYLNEKDIINGVGFSQTKRYSIARGYLNLIPEVVTAPAKALLTIALIPPILKYVFGLEKKSHKDSKTNSAIQNYAVIGFKSANAPTKKVFQNFVGGSK